MKPIFIEIQYLTDRWGHLWRWQWSSVRTGCGLTGLQAVSSSAWGSSKAALGRSHGTSRKLSSATKGQSRHTVLELMT